MDVYKKFEDIKSKLRKNGNCELANQINELQISGGTIGEVFISVLRFIEEHFESSQENIDVIKDEYVQLKNYAKELNYI